MKNNICKMTGTAVIRMLAIALASIVVYIIVLLLVLNGKEKEASKIENLYPLCGIVTEVDYKKDYIVIEDFTGNLWVWEGAEDWGRKDIASMIMDDKGTDLIIDDEIVKIYYSGWVE